MRALYNANNQKPSKKVFCFFYITEPSRVLSADSKSSLKVIFRPSLSYFEDYLEFLSFAVSDLCERSTMKIIKYLHIYYFALLNR